MDPGELDLKELKSRYAILEEDCKLIQERVERSFQALMSIMSIIESQSTISQTQSINKLTELAFIFIPLSFASSFSGMNVREWDTEKPRVALFWAFSCGLLLSVYIMRLSIRSQFLASLSSRLKQRVAAVNAVPKGQKIQTRAWLQFYLVPNRKIMFVTLCVMVVVPLALIWELWLRRPGWVLWQPLLASNAVVGLFCILTQAAPHLTIVESLKIAELCSMVLLYILILGIPSYFL
ncbi:hypothetical protein BDD12DRAFT_526412 [Trichophaea hybrida]|nr:hypothetical protein BDD12DRAFT_526412 [Trichophaea hybrida]